MGRKWIIDVLVDLRAFAETNHMPVLADELRQAARVAEQELESMQGRQPEPASARRDGLPPVATEGHGHRGLSPACGAGGGA